MNKFQNSYMRSLALVGFSSFVESYGKDPEELVSDVGLDPSILTETNRIYPYQSHVDLWELASERLQEPNFGLKFALSTAPDFANIGPIMVLSQFETTSGNWLRSAIRYLKYHNSGTQFSVIPIEGTDDVILRLSTDPFIKRGRQVTETDAALTLLMARQTLNSPLVEPKIVRFPHSQPEDLRFHNQIFGCEFEFNAPVLETVADKEFLNIPLKSPMRMIRPVAYWFFNKVVESSPITKTSTSHKVRMTIGLHLGTKRLNNNDVAATLEKHPKQMQRELAAEGETYSSILESVREEVACTLLATSTTPIFTIAGYLDYSSSSAFVMAFKRWKGMTPKRFRQQMKDEVGQ